MHVASLNCQIFLFGPGLRSLLRYRSKDSADTSQTPPYFLAMIVPLTARRLSWLSENLKRSDASLVVMKSSISVSDCTMRYKGDVREARDQDVEHYRSKLSSRVPQASPESSAPTENDLGLALAEASAGYTHL